MLTFFWKFTVFHFLITSCRFLNHVTREENPNIPATAKYFTTIGKYEEVNRYLIEDILAVNRSMLQPPSAQCHQIHLTAIIRHGTRYPTTQSIKKMQKLQGPEMRRVQEKIANRLRVLYNNITHDMAESAFDLCALFAIKAVNSPWCQLFDEADAKVMEYASDLREYWKRGYGYNNKSKSSCILLHDVFSWLNKSASENKSGQQVTEAVTVQVGHASTLLPLLTLLGFFKDNDTLTSTNYADQTERSFRTSRMLPFAANLLLVLYDCGGGDLRLQPLFNEKPVTFPGLTDQQASMLLYQDIREHYRILLQGCDFETECQLFK